jgi:CubicO group peptidase (beta-lactamase class C family)
LNNNKHTFSSSAATFLIVCSLTISFSPGLKAQNFVTKIQQGYTAEASYELHEQWNMMNFILLSQSGAYSYLHLGEFLPQAMIHRAGDVRNLVKALDPRIGKIQIKTESGTELSFDNVVLSESSPIQGVLVLHRGQVVYEQYPGMRENDSHVWMSVAKPFTSLLIGQLESEGKIDINNTLGAYMPRVRGTNWEDLKIIDALNMQTGLDVVEGRAQRGDPSSMISRFFAAEVGIPDFEGNIRTHNEVLLSAGVQRPPAEAFEYSSAITQMLGLLIEDITNKRLAELISERIWRHAGMTGDATLTLSPQGNGIIHGLVSSRLIDLARVGLLYTPSWSKTASHKIVPDNLIKNIQQSGNPDSYHKGGIGPMLSKVFAENSLTNSYQWDAVFDDGDFYKGGMNGQGLLVSPGNDVVVAWFASGYAEVSMEAFARKIAQSFTEKEK